MEILKGVPASEGIAIGRIYCYEPQTYTGAEAYFEGDPAAQIAAFCRAKEHALAELSALAEELSAQYPEQARIFLAHQEMLQDEELTEEVLMRITSQHAAPEYAVELAISAFAAILSGVNDPLIAARVADLMDIKKRLLRNLRGNAEQTLSHFTEPVIVVTHDLLPSDTAKMDLHHVLGIVTEIGSETSSASRLCWGFQTHFPRGNAQKTAFWTASGGNWCWTPILRRSNMHRSGCRHSYPHALGRINS